MRRDENGRAVCAQSLRHPKYLQWTDEVEFFHIIEDEDADIPLHGASVTKPAAVIGNGGYGVLTAPYLVRVPRFFSAEPS
jgi:hypothetical protein